MGLDLVSLINHYFHASLPRGYEVIQRGGERHGLWEWAAAREDSGLARLILVFAGWSGTRALQLPYELEAWAAADDGQRFGSEVVSRRSVDRREDLESALRELVTEAGDRANHLDAEALTTGFGFPPEWQRADWQRVRASRAQGWKETQTRLVQPSLAGGWEVRRPGARRASSRHRTKAAAERRAREILSRLGGGEVVIESSSARVSGKRKDEPARSRRAR
jgi:hypothetical protein